MSATDEREPSRVRDYWDYLWSPVGAALAGQLLIVTAGVGLAIAAPQQPAWVYLALLLLFVVSTWALLAVAVGYRPATAAELEQLRSGYLWHVTSALNQVAGAAVGADGEVVLIHLDPTHCRFSSRMLDRSRPLQRRRTAVYAFTNPPRPAQLSMYVSRGRRAAVLRLDGAHVDQAYIGRHGAIALPNGYRGPADITD